MIIVNLKGGLGNQMFQYALGRRLALKNNDVLKLDTGGLARANEVGDIYRPFLLDAYTIEKILPLLMRLKNSSIPTAYFQKDGDGLHLNFQKTKIHFLIQRY